MEKMTIFLPENTIKLLHLLARESGKTVGTVVQEMALDRYMTQAMGAAYAARIEAELDSAAG